MSKYDVTSSIKPEVHDVSLRHKRRTDPLAFVKLDQIFSQNALSRYEIVYLEIVLILAPSENFCLLHLFIYFVLPYKMVK